MDEPFGVYCLCGAVEEPEEAVEEVVEGGAQTIGAGLGEGGRVGQAQCGGGLQDQSLGLAQPCAGVRCRQETDVVAEPVDLVRQ